MPLNGSSIRGRYNGQGAQNREQEAFSPEADLKSILTLKFEFTHWRSDEGAAGLAENQICPPFSFTATISLPRCKARAQQHSSNLANHWRSGSFPRVEQRLRASTNDTGNGDGDIVRKYSFLAKMPTQRSGTNSQGNVRTGCKLQRVSSSGGFEPREGEGVALRRFIRHLEDDAEPRRRRWQL